jgi:hypothetical protein
MPVRKFRSVAEMPPPASYRPGDPRLYRAVEIVLDMARAFSPRRFEPGVERFRSFDDMDRVQAAREAGFVRALSRNRKSSS